jgi:iron complex outermembrane receptor protein
MGLALCGPASAQSSNQSEDGARASKIEMVVVTAERREESAQRTAASVTAVTADQLDQLYVHNLTDLSQQAPNFTIEGVGAMSRSSAVIYSRGIGYSGIDGVEPPVGVSVDGMFYAVNVGTLQNIFDVDSVQILLGPQGTLFGRNTTGGVVLITTNNPTDQYQLEGKVRLGNYGRLDTNFMANIPLDDTLQARVAIATQHSDGAYKNL